MPVYAPCDACAVIFGALFALASKESLAQGLTLEVRLLLQLGYDLPARGLASKVLLLTSALNHATSRSRLARCGP